MYSTEIEMFFSGIHRYFLIFDFFLQLVQNFSSKKKSMIFSTKLIFWKSNIRCTVCLLYNYIFITVKTNLLLQTLKFALVKNFFQVINSIQDIGNSMLHYARGHLFIRSSQNLMSLSGILVKTSQLLKKKMFPSEFLLLFLHS